MLTSENPEAFNLSIARFRIVQVIALFRLEESGHQEFHATMLKAGFRKNVIWGDGPLTLAEGEWVACEGLIPGASSNAEDMLQHLVCSVLKDAGIRNGRVEISVSADMWWIG
ncbi:MAG TPA: hypothetical protein VK829_08365 [Terriglobales bacterium]|jgi:hypothetical protein|nr:hypothetical protein [Terriglobales bacterium]